MKSHKNRCSLVLLAIAAFTTGCASIAVSEDSIETRTASALGLTKGSFVVSNRIDEGMKSTYTVKTTGQRTYSCYVTGVVTISGRSASDAVCTDVTGIGKPAAKPPESASCNALTKAAGKCN